MDRARLGQAGRRGRAAPGGVGVIIGITLIAERTPTACTGAVLHADSGDGGCFAYSRTLEGTAVIVISVMLAILFWLTGALAKIGVLAKGPR